MYTIGHAETMHNDPRLFDDLETAEIAAIELSRDGKVWAVFESSEAVALIFDERIYTP